MEILSYIYVFLIGLIIGSFLNMAIWRLYKRESWLGRSRCPKCKKNIFWYDNIPILSYLLLRGKCRHCQTSIGYQYPIIELATGGLFLLGYLAVPQTSGFGYEVFRLWLFMAIFLVIFVYDLRWYFILDQVTLPAMILALAINLALGFSWLNLLLAGIIGGGFFLLQFVVSQGRWIGGGDIRLGFLMGLVLGYPQILVALFIAYMLGGLVAMPLLLMKKKQWGDKIPFGTFLSVATIISLLWGKTLLSWYVSWL